MVSFLRYYSCFICANCTHSAKKVIEDTDNYTREIDILVQYAEISK